MQRLSESVNQTLAIGNNLARNLSGGEIILLSGPLGAGKTILAKGIAQGLGLKKNTIISPTFVLLRIHEGRLTLQHFDLYRIKGPQDILALGYEEYFYPAQSGPGAKEAFGAVTIIEWPERLEFLQPQEFLRIRLTFKDKNKRALIFSAKGQRYGKLLGKIKK